MMKGLFLPIFFSFVGVSSSFTVPLTKTATKVATRATSLSSCKALKARQENQEVEGANRRNVISQISIFASASLISLVPTSVWASGGATAGGVYLLSAKQRYNERVTAGIKDFLKLKSSMKSGDLSPTKEFFTTDDVGGWKDFSSAAYLLSNAFRRSSSTAPDSLPSVQKWKAFAANVNGMDKALKKKKSSEVSSLYDKALASLDDYLDAVELPSMMEMGQ